MLLMCGRCPLGILVAEGHIVLEGDHRLRAAFRQWFRGCEPPGPGRVQACSRWHTSKRSRKPQGLSEESGPSRTREA